MIGGGKAVNQIAEELHVSANTVRTYRTRILEKLGVKGTSELIHYAITQRLAGRMSESSERQPLMPRARPGILES